MNNISTILIAEDHPLVTLGLRHIITQINSALKIVEVDNCVELMQKVRALKPNYVIVDLHLTDGLSINTIENIIAVFPETRVMVYTSFPENIYANKLFQLGVQGFLSKDAPLTELEMGVGNFLSNRFYVSPAFLSTLFPKIQNIPDGKNNPFDLLTLQETVVVDYIRMGVPFKEIGEKMGIMANTASVYKKRAFEKLEIENVVQLSQLYELYQTRKA